jgi:hypothetical protein
MHYAEIKSCLDIFDEMLDFFVTTLYISFEPKVQHRWFVNNREAECIINIKCKPKKISILGLSQIQRHR